MEPKSILITGKVDTGGSGLCLRAGRFPMATPGSDRHTAQPQGPWTQKQPQPPRSRVYVGFLCAAWLPPLKLSPWPGCFPYLSPSLLLC